MLDYNFIQCRCHFFLRMILEEKIELLLINRFLKEKCFPSLIWWPFIVIIDLCAVRIPRRTKIRLDIIHLKYSNSKKEASTSKVFMVYTRIPGVHLQSSSSNCNEVILERLKSHLYFWYQNDNLISFLFI